VRVLVPSRRQLALAACYARDLAPRRCWGLKTPTYVSLEGEGPGLAKQQEARR
jgi:hypothetical protein